MDLLRRRIVEVMDRIDDLTSGKGLRAAQKRSLWECRRMLARILKRADDRSATGREQVLSSVLSAISRTCELLNAYFSKRH